MKTARKCDDEIEGLARDWPDLEGVCGHCGRTVSNADPVHRVTPILKGGRGVECKRRGDYL
jgi:hypothetical protein